ncbi:MAG: hypothetical protein Q7T87_18230 [Polaromonas sp.]|nr:hypothetical protein [Polaromonas sp.]
MSEPLPIMTRRARTLVRVLWPSFMAACLMEGLVFGLVDPGDVHWPASLLQPPRLGLYTVAFFVFWAIHALSGAVALWLARPGRDL